MTRSSNGEGYPSYETYQETGVGWMPTIPGHWDSVQARFVARLESGHTPSRSVEEYWEDCYIPWVTTTDLKPLREDNKRVIHETTHEISELGLQNSGARILPAGTVFLSRTASVGESGIMGREMATSQDFANWVPGDKIESEYLLYCFRGMEQEFERVMQGSTHNTIYMDDLRSLTVPLPPLDEQHRIASFLNHHTARIDQLAEKKQRLLELLQEKRQAVITKAVTTGGRVDKHLEELSLPWFDRLPSNWEVVRLSRLITEIEQGWSPQCDDKRTTEEEWGVLKAGCVNDMRFRPEEHKRLPGHLDPKPELEISQGDVLMSRANTRELVGSCGRVDQPTSRLMLCDKLYRLHFSVQKVDPTYLTLALNSDPSRAQIEQEATGASSSMLNISQRLVRELWVPLPPLEEQQRIAEEVRRQLSILDETRSAVESGQDLLREKRQTLITAAVTGQIDVTSWEPPEDDKPQAEAQPTEAVEA